MYLALAKKKFGNFQYLVRLRVLKLPLSDRKQSHTHRNVPSRIGTLQILPLPTFLHKIAFSESTILFECPGILEHQSSTPPSHKRVSQLHVHIDNA
jgi:hypothetical protein